MTRPSNGGIRKRSNRHQAPTSRKRISTSLLARHLTDWHELNGQRNGPRQRGDLFAVEQRQSGNDLHVLQDVPVFISTPEGEMS